MTDPPTLEPVICPRCQGQGRIIMVHGEYPRPLPASGTWLAISARVEMCPDCEGNGVKG